MFCNNNVFRLRKLLINKYLTLTIRSLGSIGLSKMNSINCKNSIKLNGDSMIDNIRREYHDYEGGNLELIKDDNTGIATLCMNSVERRNALSGTMMSELCDIITELEQWKLVNNNLIIFSTIINNL